jgi:hypothetical protein
MERIMNKPSIVFCALPFLVCVRLLIGQTSEDRSQIEIKEVRPVTANGGSRLQQVTVSLNFPGEPSIYLDDFGQLPSKTTLSYITESARLTVRSRRDGQPLADRMLLPTAISMGGGDLDQVPRDSFKYFGGNGPAPTTLHFRAAQADVLLKRFLFPAYVYTHNANTFSETRYHRLSVDERNLIVEVAAQLSFPSDASTDAGFELRYAVRERRKGTDWQAEPSSTGATAASNFVADLTKELIRNE